MSDQDIDYDDTASAVKAIIDAMPQLVERGISVAVNDGIDGTTAQTITYNARSGKVSQELGKISLIGNNLNSKITSTALTTPHQSGWTTGSGYQVEIHMYKFRCLEVEKNGKLRAKDL
jgi:hypothetical protein